MSNKSFISLSFLNAKIQLIQLDSKKQKVIYKLQADLPEGVIFKNKVSSTQDLAVFIRQIWNKLNINEKNVALCIPEISTFINNFDLPKIDIKDLNEAVRWAAREFLPMKITNMSLDWIIVGETKTSYNILLYAVEKELLSGYIESLVAAGLTPIAVETPSTALVRLAGHDTSLIIYGNSGETLVVISNNNHVVVSSIVEGDVSEVVSTIQKVIKHYKNFTISKVYVGGILESTVLEAVKKVTEVEPNLLNYNVATLSRDEVQSYLVSLSVQNMVVDEPGNGKYLNLLPKYQIKLYKNRLNNSRAWLLAIVFSFGIWISAIVAVGSLVYLNQQYKSLKLQNSSSLKVVQETKEDRDSIRLINNSSAKIASILSKPEFPEEIVNSLYAVKPPGINILELDIDIDLGTVVVNGISANRNDLLTYKKALEAQPHFHQITLPISSFEIERNINFQLSLIYLNE